MFSMLLGALLLNCYAILLIFARALVFRTRLYRPMLWNIWLSILPVLILVVGFIALLASIMFSRPLSLVILIITTVVWLLMLPNASYLITELNQSHRTENDPVPLWFDIILVISLAMSGVANTVVNVLIAHLMAAAMLFNDTADTLVRPLVLTTVGVVMLLIAFGMYLGRYPRFNSWDLKHPISFLRKLSEHFSQRANVLACIGFTLSYAVFLCLIYLLTAGPVIESILNAEQLRTLLTGG